MTIKLASIKASLTRPFTLGLLAGSILLFALGVAFAQDQSDEPPSGQEQAQPPSEYPDQPGDVQVQPTDPNQQPPEAPPKPAWHRFGPPRANARAPQQGPQNQPDPQQEEEQTGQPPEYQDQPEPAPQVPGQLIMQRGTYVTVRVDQFLSSNKNVAGDAFTATLTQPLVVDGLVVAQRGQTVGGRVSDAQKAGKVKGVSRLAVELTDLTLVDGSKVPIRTQLDGAAGPTGKANDVAIVGATTGIGAAIGAGAGGGAGAAIGAGGGAIAATLGVLLTRGRATEIYPETELTFRVAAPVEISTARAPQAFHYAGPQDYGQPAGGQRAPNLQARGRYGYAYGMPGPYYYGPGYYNPYYYGWGPSFGFYYGPGYYGRGYYRGGHRYYGGGARYYGGHGGSRSYGRGSRGRR